MFPILGASLPRFDPLRDLPGLAPGSVVAADIQRCAKLADGYIVNDPHRAGVLTDIRCSMLPTSITPLWGIDLNLTTPAQHVTFEVYRERPDNARDLFMVMLPGRDLPD